MDPQKLRVFLAVVDGGTALAAAERLGMTQPGISRGVGALERDLGVALFDRRGKRLVLNASGRALVPHAREIVAAVDTARRLTTGAAHDGRVPITVGLTDSFVARWFPAGAGQAASLMSRAKLTWTVERTHGLLRKLSSGEIDAAMVVSRQPPALGHTVALGPHPSRYWARADRYPQLARVTSFEQLADLPVVALNAANGPEAQEMPSGLVPFVTASSISAVKALVLAGAGAGYLPGSALSDDDRRSLVASALLFNSECQAWLVCRAVRNPLMRELQTALATAWANATP